MSRVCWPTAWRQRRLPNSLATYFKSLMTDQTSNRRGTLVALLVAGAYFMEMLDGTVIATALPAMAASFKVNPVDLNLGMTAYMLTLAVLIPASGWVAERHGARNVFAGAILVFTVASVLCACTNSVSSFTAARVLQGAGGALMVPVGRLIVMRTVEKQDLVRATAYITWPALVAPVLGPPLGGFITSYASWRWIFYLNVPVGLVGAVLAWLLIRNQQPEERRPLDWQGFILVGSSCLCIVYGMSIIGGTSRAWRLPGFFLIMGIVLARLAYVQARRHPSPLLDLQAFRTPTYTASIRGGSVLRTAINAVPFLLPLMFQVGFGMNAFKSGLLMLALFAGNLGMKPGTTAALRRFGFRNILVFNGLILAASFVIIGLFTAATPTLLMIPVLVVSGMARSMQYTALATVAFADMPKSSLIGSNTFFSLLMQLSVGMGVAVGVVVLKVGAFFTGTTSAALTVTDFHVAFMLLGVVTVAGLLDSVALPPEAGAQVSRHRRYVRLT